MAAAAVAAAAEEAIVHRRERRPDVRMRRVVRLRFARSSNASGAPRSREQLNPGGFGRVAKSAMRPSM